MYAIRPSKYGDNWLCHYLPQLIRFIITQSFDTVYTELLTVSLTRLEQEITNRKLNLILGMPLRVRGSEAVGKLSVSLLGRFTCREKSTGTR